jgi:NADH-quinone oxidoreductase subunit J
MYVFFFLFAIGGIASALMVITRKNVMHAALFLLLTFFCVGATYVLLRAELLAAVQVLVYAGAVMVLFLLPFSDQYTAGAPDAPMDESERCGGGAGGPDGVVDHYCYRQSLWQTPACLRAMPSTLGTPQAIGRALFTDYVLPFEIASIILLAAMVGAIYLARNCPGRREHLRCLRLRRWPRPRSRAGMV